MTQTASGNQLGGKRKASRKLHRRSINHHGSHAGRSAHGSTCNTTPWLPSPHPRTSSPSRKPFTRGDTNRLSPRDHQGTPAPMRCNATGLRNPTTQEIGSELRLWEHGGNRQFPTIEFKNLLFCNGFQPSSLKTFCFVMV